MQEYELRALRKRAFQCTQKRDYKRLLARETNWTECKVRKVLIHRGDLVQAKQHLRRKNGDPAASHEQFIAVSLIKDGWHNPRMSAVGWSHDLHDDFPNKFDWHFLSRRYSPRDALDIRRLSRASHWPLPQFRDEVAETDQRIREGGELTMVVKVPDSADNLLRPLRITSPIRRRKSGMKLWQKRNSIYHIAKDVGYMVGVYDHLLEREQKRLGFTNRELDKLVLRPLNAP